MIGKQGKKVMRLTVALLAFVLAWSNVSIFAGGRSERQIDDVIRVPILLRDGGNDANTEMYRELIEIYNRRFEGRYVLDIEWVPGMAAERREKLRVLNSARDLPAVVTDLGVEPAFAELLMNNGRLMDLAPYFSRDSEWQQLSFPESVAFNTRPSGEMFTAPVPGTQYIGVFYNKDLFAQAGIARFPETWDEFWNAADALQAQGITPLSMHTQETGWVANLWLTAYLASSPEGADIMDIKYPIEEFTSPAFLDAIEVLQRLFSYSTPDAIGGNYATAANLFTSGRTAMIANGPWMIPSFSNTEYSPAGFENSVGYSHFPGNIMISNQGAQYGLGVSMDHPLEVREGAIEWIKLLTGSVEGIRLGIQYLGELSTLVSLTDEQRADMGQIQIEYLNAVANTTQTIPWFQSQWDPITQNETVVRNLPQYILGEISAEEYARLLADSARRFSESQ